MNSTRYVIACTLCAVLLCGGTAVAQTDWSSLGGPFGGRVFAVAGDASGTLYAGGEMGVFISSDAGASWQGGDILGPQGLSFLVAGSTVYAGTSRGVYNSIDGGASWSAPISTSRFSTWALAIDGSKTIYAGTDLIMADGSIAAPLYRSNDQGITWTAFATGLPQDYVFALAVGSTGDVYAGTGSGLYRLASGSNRWTAESVTDGVYAFLVRQDTIFAGTDVGVVARVGRGNWSIVGATMTDAVYSFTPTSTGFLAGTNVGVYAFTSRSRTWSNVTLAGQQVYSLATTARGTFAAIYGGNGMYRSVNNGATWTVANSGIHTPLYALIADENSIYSGGPGGLFRYSNATRTWMAAGLTATTTNGLALLSPGVLLACTDDGVEISSDSGTSWLNVGLSARNSYAAIAIGSTVFIGTDSGIYTVALPQLTMSAAPQLASTAVLGFAVSPSGTLFAATDNGVAASLDGGATWDVWGISGGVVWSMAVRNAGEAYAATELGLFRSADSGRTWANVALLDSTTLSVVVDPMGHVFAASYYGVLFSTNGGSTFRSMNSGLADVAVSVLALDPLSRLIAASRSGVFRTQSSTAVREAGIVAPGKIGLLTVSPNPTTSVTRIQYELRVSAGVELLLFDILGREVVRLDQGVVPAGTRSATVDISTLPAGTYLVRVAADGRIVGWADVVRGR
jgi:hypothetical protein